MILEPKNNIFTRSNSLDFLWQKYGNSVSYELQIDDNQKFSSPVFDFSQITDTKITLNVPLEDHHFRIRAVLDNGYKTMWNCIHFTILPTEHIIKENYSRTTSIFPVDLDKDGNMDILSSADLLDQIVWWRNNGNQKFTSNIIEGNYDKAKSVSGIDIDNDGDIDVLAAAYPNLICWWENEGNQNFKKHLITKLLDEPKIVKAVDIDNDGDIDIFGVSLTEIIICINDGENNFYIRFIDLQISLHSNCFVDLDKDGDIDLIGNTNEKPKKFIWLEYIGSFVYKKHIISDIEIGYRFAKDMDNDNDIDLISYYPFTYWENNGKQQFEAIPLDNNNEYTVSLCPADIDGDNDIDILGTHYWWENRRNQNFKIHSINAPNINTRKVHPVDIDGDNDIDILSLSADENYDLYKISWWEMNLDQ